MYHSTKLLVLSLTFLLFFNCKEKESIITQTKKPNVVFLFADDFTYEAIHALGNSSIKTPNLDKLVKRGTTFTHAYNMGGWNGAICVASRAMIISGQSIWNAKATTVKWAKKDSASISQTWGKRMEQQGYQTFMTGKWHVNAPAATVFQQAKNIRPGMPNDLRGQNWATFTKAIRDNKDIIKNRAVAYWRPISKNDTTWSASDPKFNGYWEGGKHWSEVVKDDALGFLDTALQNKEAPFFMYLAFNAPHDPRQAPQSFLDLYDINKLEAPKNWLPEYPYKDSIGNVATLRDEALAPFPRTGFAIKTHLKEYYAIITHLDEQIGKILTAIEASGEKDNTYIFFTGDHGLSVGHHGLIGKQSMFDHSMRVPLMVSGPNIPQDKKIKADVYLQDIMATSLEIAGADNSKGFFHSLMDLATNKTTSGNYENGIYGAYMNSQRMIRKNGLKLIVYPKIKKVLLFDLEKDPLEMNNIADENKEKTAKLFKELQQLQIEMNDPLDISNCIASI